MSGSAGASSRRAHSVGHKRRLSDPSGREGNDSHLVWEGVMAPGKRRQVGNSPGGPVQSADPVSVENSAGLVPAKKSASPVLTVLTVSKPAGPAPAANLAGLVPIAKPAGPVPATKPASPVLAKSRPAGPAPVA